MEKQSVIDLVLNNKVKGVKTIAVVIKRKFIDRKQRLRNVRLCSRFCKIKDSGSVEKTNHPSKLITQSVRPTIWLYPSEIIQIRANMMCALWFRVPYVTT